MSNFLPQWPSHLLSLRPQPPASSLSALRCSTWPMVSCFSPASSFPVSMNGHAWPCKILVQVPRQPADPSRPTLNSIELGSNDGGGGGGAAPSSGSTGTGIQLSASMAYAITSCHVMSSKIIVCRIVIPSHLQAAMRCLQEQTNRHQGAIPRAVSQICKAGQESCRETSPPLPPRHVRLLAHSRAPSLVLCCPSRKSYLV